MARMSIELSPDDSTSDSDGSDGDSDRPQVLAPTAPLANFPAILAAEPILASSAIDGNTQWPGVSAGAPRA